MKLTELERIVALQQKAYRLLLWQKEQVRHIPATLNPEQTEALRSGDTCVEWIKLRKLKTGLDQNNAWATQGVNEINSYADIFITDGGKASAIRELKLDAAYKTEVFSMKKSELNALTTKLAEIVG